MKRNNYIFTLIIIVANILISNEDIMAQEGTALQMQGLNYRTNQSVVSRGAGGILFGIQNDPSIMFQSPALLTTVKGLQISLGGYQQYIDQKQEKHYGTLQSHEQFMLLLDGTLLDRTKIPDRPSAYYDSLIQKGKTPTQADSIQRPFDTIMPNWDRSKNVSLPLQAFITAPFKLANYHIVVGIGAVEYANLNWFYQNNNTLSPNVLDVAHGISQWQMSLLPTADSTATPTKRPLPVQWYQYSQYRNGSIYGYGGAISIEISPKFSVGISGMYLDGETDDEEVCVGRGRALFYYSSIRLDKVGMTSWRKVGKSTYSGYDFTISSTYKSPFLTVGFTLKPPTTITRDYSYTLWKDSTITSYNNGKIDSAHAVTNTSIHGKDKMKLPFSGSIGISAALRKNIVLGFEYEILPYESATYNNDVSDTNPWLSYSVIKIGAEYAPVKWMSLRAGVSEIGDVFQPATNPLRGKSVRYPVYSIGLGVSGFGATLNVAYEYSDRRYTDTWSNSASVNKKIVQNLIVSVSYIIPTFWE
ncbi:MAG TPA: hypothetical protein PK595_00810 [Bacteroidota bacterium]|nr:hypothetical protein [Bacteroidota bacterium]